MVTQFFPYKAWATHHVVEGKAKEEIESRATSYLTVAFLLPKVTVYIYALHQELGKVASLTYT